MAQNLTYAIEEEKELNSSGLQQSNTAIGSLHPFKLTQPQENTGQEIKFKKAPQSQMSIRMLKKRVEKHYKNHSELIGHLIKKLEDQIIQTQDFQSQAFITFEKEAYGILSSFYDLKIEFISFVDFDVTKMLESVAQNLEYMGITTHNKLILNLASVPNFMRANFAIIHYLTIALSIIGQKYAEKQVVNLRLSVQNNEHNHRTQFLQFMLNFRSKTLTQKLLTQLLKQRIAQDSFENFKSCIEKFKGLAAFTTALNLCYGQILKAQSIRHQNINEIQIKINVECPISKLANSFNKSIKFYVNQAQVPLEQPGKEEFSSADELESQSDEELETGMSALAQMNMEKKSMKQIKPKEEEQGGEQEGGMIFTEQNKIPKISNLDELEF